MGALLQDIRVHVHPSSFIDNEAHGGKLRASTAILGMLGVLAAILLIARLITLVIGA
jgi:hypothetical protein